MLNVNTKKSIRLKNRTKYFNPATDRTHVRFSSPDSYQSRQIKIEGYESRLYWQFRWCEDTGGQTFFYTLTYNDNAIPHHYGVNCFDYEDIRYMTNGAFKKMLERKYGTQMHYFVGAELGDGKGSRGMHNNPHYHVLFFLEDGHYERYPYKPISPEEFRHLVREYWQGFDEDTDGFVDYQYAKYGIAKEGENCGKVTDFRACMYCAKYVTKDAQLKRTEDKVLKYLRFTLKEKYKYSEEVYKAFFKSVIYEMYNVPLNAKKTKWAYNDAQLIDRIIPDAVFSLDVFTDLSNVEIDSYTPYVADICNKEHLWKKYFDFLKEYIEDEVKKGLNEWRNRYSNKVRISQGVGDYALQFIDKENPTVQVPSKKGFKNRPINMYYYRKLFTTVEKDKKGSNIRVLNEDGIRYKLNRLESQIDKMVEKTRANLSILTPELFAKMRESDVNTEVFMTYHEFFERMEYLYKENNIDNILRRYAEYKLVYEDRFFPYHPSGEGDDSDFPPIDVRGDYARFLVPSFYSVSRSDLRLDAFLQDAPEDYMAYLTHPYFCRYIGVFNVFDLCADYLFIQGDNKAQRDAEQIAATKRFHNERKLREFYAGFRR